jgi:uncharacterized membrane protein YkvA (DUF1232 family)
VLRLLRWGIEREVTVKGVLDVLANAEPEIDKAEAVDLADVLARFVNTTPDALGLALLMSKDPASGRAIAFATGQILTYLFDEDDLLPERTFGGLGYLDDAYLAHAYVRLLSAAFPHVDTSTASYQAPSELTLEVVERLLPPGVAQALSQAAESILSVAASLFGGGGDATEVARIAPVLGVRDAMQALSSDARA